MKNILTVALILGVASSGLMASALSFTADTGANAEYVDCGNDAELQMGTHDLTVEFWLKTAVAETQKIISNGGQTASDDGYSIKIISSGYIKAEVSDGTTILVKQNNAVIANDGNWHHCAVVFDRDHQLRVCVDGTCQTQLMENFTNGNCDNTNDTFVLGRKATTSATQSFTGSLDEVRIWNTVLDTATVSAWKGHELTSSHPDISALQAYYKFNEGSGTTANDLTSDYLGNHESDGTITNAQYVDSDIPDFTANNDGDLPEYYDCAGVPNGSAYEDACGVCDSDTSNDCEPDTVNGALSFTADTGANAEYVDCGNDAELQMGTHDLTVEFWLKTAVAETQKIISNGGQTASDDGYSIKIISSGYIKAEVSDGTTILVKQNNAVIANDGNWHHCAVVFDRDHQLRVCVDGTCQTQLMENFTNGNCDNTNDTFVLGRKATTSATQSFTGSLDEVRIWNTVLDTATVSAWKGHELTSSHPDISALQAYYKFNEGSGTTANDLTSDYLGNHESDGTITNAQYVDSDIPDFTQNDDEDLQDGNECDDVDADGICDDVDDCVGAYDECGICNGDGIADGACDCDGNEDLGCGCGEAGPSGCDNACGSTAEVDECGECGGDGSSCACEPGDVNDDGSVNVLDIVEIVGYIVNGEGDFDLACADNNGDGAVNVLDIVALVNDILGGSRVNDATSARLIKSANGLVLQADGYIGGVQMTLSHGTDFTIELSDNAWISDYSTKGNQTILVLVQPTEGKLFTSNGDFEIVDMIIANSYDAVSTMVVREFSLSSAYPNPFNPTTSMTLAVPVAGKVSVQVYNIMGQVVATLISGHMNASTYTLTWDASSVSSGIYFVKAEAVGSVTTQKLVLMK